MNKKMKLFFLCFVLMGGVTAACLGTMTFMLATGEAPFDTTPLKPYLPEKLKKAEPEKTDIEKLEEKLPSAVDGGTVNEVYLVALHNELKKQEVDLETRKKVVNDKEKMVDSRQDLIKSAIAELAKKHKELEAFYEKKEKVLSDKSKAIADDEGKMRAYFKGQNGERLKELSETVSGMSSEAQINFIYYLDRTTAANVLYSMKLPTRSKILDMLYQGRIKGENGEEDKTLPSQNRQALRIAAQEIVTELQKIRVEEKSPATTDQ